VLNLDPTPAASPLPAARSNRTSAAGGPAASHADAFDTLLSQLTEVSGRAQATAVRQGASPADPAAKAAAPPTDPAAKAAAPPADPATKAAAPPAIDKSTALWRGFGAVPAHTRPSDRTAVAGDSPAATSPADDAQVSASSLAWLLACAAPIKTDIKTENVPPLAEAGTAADTGAAPQGVAVATERGAVHAAVAAVTAPSGAAAARNLDVPFAPEEPSGTDRAAAPEATRSPGPPPIDKPAAPASTAQMAALLRAASAQIDASAADLPTNADADNRVTAGAQAAVSGAAARLDTAARETPPVGSSIAANVSSEIGAVEPPSASRSATPATTIASVTVAESRLADARGSSKKDGHGPDDGRADSSSPRAAATPATGTVFQMSSEMRLVGGLSTAAGAVEVPVTAGGSLASETDLPGQIVQAIRLQWAGGVGDARITLQPEYLGELSIAIRVEHGAVTAALESSVPAVRQWIDAHQPMLRQALAAQGLELERLVTTDTQAAPDRKREEQPEPRQQHEGDKHPRRRTKSDAPAFELIA
jgi:flagellar hook-length control protein FliK